jgi:hypothetical protein
MVNTKQNNRYLVTVESQSEDIRECSSKEKVIVRPRRLASIGARGINPFLRSGGAHQLVIWSNNFTVGRISFLRISCNMHSEWRSPIMFLD